MKAFFEEILKKTQEVQKMTEKNKFMAVMNSNIEASELFL
jgi:hypothetical protein